MLDDGRESTHSAVCLICDIRIHLFPNTNVLRVHGRNWACPGNCTDQYRDLELLLVLDPNRFYGYRQITEVELQEHAELSRQYIFRSSSNWRKRWKTNEHLIVLDVTHK